MLRIRVLGELELELDGEPLPIPRGRRLQSLLAWLVLHPGLRDRGEVAGSLWPDVLDDSARASLRGALALLRRELGEGASRYIVASRERVGVSPGVWIDAEEFERLLAAGSPEEALALVRGELLDGLTEDWVYSARDQHRDRRLEVLTGLAEQAEADGDLPRAIAQNRELLRLDPLSEPGHRELIRRLAAAGDRTGALAAYERARERMARELGIAPSAQTRLLVAEVRGTGDGAAQSLPVAAAPALPAAIDRSYRSPLVGRGAVIERLGAAWELAQRDGTRFVLLCGEAGIGKTRVIAEFAANARASGATVLYGRAPEQPLAPYQPFAEALRPLVAATEPDALALRAGLLAGELSRLLPDQGARLPPQADRSERDPEGARYRLFEAVGSLLAAAARSTPLLLVIDDLHWADRPTLLMLGHIARASPRSMLLIAAYREGELGQADPLLTTVADLRRDVSVERVLLGGLVQDQVKALAEGWLGAAAEASLIEALCDASGGNPFFIEELLRHVEERGCGSGDGPRSLSALGLPEGVKDVVRARLARLGPAAQSLRLAAVAGREFDLELLAMVEGADREELIESFDAALDAQLIREAERPGFYAFNHALVRDAIYGELSAARRALLHERIGLALERLSERRPESRLPELAHHFLLAGPEMIVKAVKYARLAARRAASQLAYESSATLYERALETLEPSAGVRRRERAELLLDLGEALLRAGEVGASRERFSEAATLARELGEPQLLSRAALGRSGLSVTVLGVDPDNVALLEEALSRVQSPDDPLRAQLLARLAIEVYYEPPSDRREQLSSTAVALARAASVPAALADALSARHVALWSAPHLDERLALADEMIALGARTGDRERELQGRNWRFMDLLELGNVTAAEEELRRHAALADRLQLPGFQWWDPMWSAMLALMRGRIEDAGALRARALALGRRAGDKVAELFAWIQDFSTRWETADEELDGPPEDVAVRPVQSALRSDLPLLLAEAGRTDEARVELDALAEHGFAAVPDDLNWLASIAGLSQAAAALGDRERARQLYDLMTPYRSRAILVGRAAICLGPADLYLGVLAGAGGDFDLASQHFDGARAWSDAAGATLWSVWCDVHRARMVVRASASGAGLPAAAALAANVLSIAERAGLARAARHAREVAGAARATV